MAKKYIEREAFLWHIKKNAPYIYHLIGTMALVFPTADVDEVVRCKDCKFFEDAHYENESELPKIKTVCRLFKRKLFAEDFCSYGERKEQEDENA